MTNAQKYLKDKSVKELFIRNKGLKGELVIDGFDNLETITCDNNELTSIKLVNLPKLNYFRANGCQLTELIVNNCSEIGYLNVGNNLLTSTDFLNSLNPEKLIFLSIHSNYFTEKDLAFLSKFTNLEHLFIDNHDKEKFEKGCYNRFTGSLQSLQNLKNLKWLNIANTDVGSGLKYLPNSLQKICLDNNWDWKEAGCLKIRKKLENISEKEILQQKELGEPDYAKNWYRITPYREARINLLEKVPFVKNLKIEIQELKKEVQEKIKLEENLVKEKKILENECQELKKKFQEQKEITSNKPIDLRFISLYSGDIITLKADGEMYLSRVGQVIQTSNSFDESVYFMLEVVEYENNKVRLRIPNENLYWKINNEKSGFFVNKTATLTDNSSEATLFLINNKDGDKITLQVDENKKYLRKDNSIIIAKEKESNSSLFSLDKVKNYQGEISNYREKIENIYFDLSRIKGKEIKFPAVAEMAKNNETDLKQKMVLSVDESINETKSFSWNPKFFLGAKTKVVAGIPQFVGGEIVIKADIGFELVGSKTNSNIKTIKEEFSVECPPRKRVEAKILIEKGEFSVPFKATIARYFIDQEGKEKKYTYSEQGEFANASFIRVYSSDRQFDLNQIGTKNQQALQQIQPTYDNIKK